MVQQDYAFSPLGLGIEPYQRRNFVLPVYLSKFDIKDGFYRLFLAANDCPRLSIILPLYPDEEQLVAIPLACTMGWTQLPPSFCTMSETVTDITNTPGCVLNRLFLYRVTA